MPYGPLSRYIGCGQEKRMAEWRQPRRKRISTISGYDLKKAHKKHQPQGFSAGLVTFQAVDMLYMRSFCLVSEVSPRVH